MSLRFSPFPGVLVALLLVSCQSPSPQEHSVEGVDAATLDWLLICRAHEFTEAEIGQALELEEEAVRELLEKVGPELRLPAPPAGEPRVLPYPGGRHPRIGFLDGAIDPHRDTKVSVFTPWDPTSYVVIDLPEAIFRGRDGGRELIYLAHTHIPTIWDSRGIELERLDWTREPDGGLSSRRRLPDGVEFGARVRPGGEHVDLELWLENGTPEPLENVTTQVCVLLKGARGFEAQTSDNKSVEGDVISAISDGGDRRISTRWDRARIWDNPPCPCIHADPAFGDVAPGQRVTVTGKLWFSGGK